MMPSTSDHYLDVRNKSEGALRHNPTLVGTSSAHAAFPAVPQGTFGSSGHARAPGYLQGMHSACSLAYSSGKDYYSNDCLPFPQPMPGSRGGGAGAKLGCGGPGFKKPGEEEHEPALIWMQSTPGAEHQPAVSSAGLSSGKQRCIMRPVTYDAVYTL